MAIELPRDANGQIIPLDTTMMYRENGNQFHVADLFFEARPGRWLARSGIECIETNKLYLDSKKRDSWKKLEEDLSRAAKYDAVAASCRYFTADRCADCRMRNGFTCGTRKTERAFADVLERIHKLRGED